MRSPWLSPTVVLGLLLSAAPAFAGATEPNGTAIPLDSKNGEVQLVFNTTEGKQSLVDSFEIRRTALMGKIPYFTTAAGALAAAQAIAAMAGGPLEVRPLQSYA